MRKIFSTTVILLLSIISFAQDKPEPQPDKVIFAISGGASAPTGEFASFDQDNPSAGAALSGFLIDITMAAKLGKKIGYAVMLRYQTNPCDIATKYPTLNITSDPYSIYGCLLGMYGSFPFSKKTSFETKILGGYLTAINPEIQLDGSVLQEKAKGDAFGYLLSIGFKHNFNKRIFMLFNADYLGSNVEFKIKDGTTTETIEQPFGLINFSFGFGFRFYK